MHDPNIESYEAFIERMAGADLPKEDTVRSHLEAQKQLAYDAESGKTLVWGDSPDAYFHALDRILRAIQEHAVAALAILDKDHRYRCRPGCPDCDIRQSPWRSTDVRVSIVPDPVPVVSRDDDGDAT